MVTEMTDQHTREAALGGTGTLNSLLKTLGEQQDGMLGFGVRSLLETPYLTFPSQVSTLV